MTAIVITATLDPSFVRPLATLRSRGIGTVVVLLDQPAFSPPAEADGAADAARQRSRAVRHALAEFEVPVSVRRPRPGPRGGPRPMTELRARRPEEGWLTLALVVVMMVVLASAIDDPAYVNGRGNLTDGLVWFALAGRRVRVHRAQGRAGAAGRRTASGPCSAGC